MRIIFMGTPDFAVPALNKISSKHDVILVVTGKDKPKGRGRAVTMSPVKECALRLGIEVIQPDNMRTDIEVKERIRALSPDCIVVAAFGQILPDEILKIPKYGCINIHASLLPKYRGAAPIQRAVINGDEKTGVTTMYMSSGLDCGDIIEQSEIALEQDETGGSLFKKLAELGSSLIMSTLEKVENGTAKRIPQNNDEAVYASKITRDMGVIDFKKSAVEIERLIRGLNPWPGAVISIDGKTYKIQKAEAAVSDKSYDPKTIVSSRKELCIATGDGLLKILEIQPPGKKSMNIADFLNGHTITNSFAD